MSPFIFSLFHEHNSGRQKINPDVKPPGFVLLKIFKNLCRGDYGYGCSADPQKSPDSQIGLESSKHHRASSNLHVSPFDSPWRVSWVKTPANLWLPPRQRIPCSRPFFRDRYPFLRRRQGVVLGVLPHRFLDRFVSIFIFVIGLLVLARRFAFDFNPGFREISAPPQRAGCRRNNGRAGIPWQNGCSSARPRARRVFPSLHRSILFSRRKGGR